MHIEVESSGEHRTPVEGRPFSVVEQVVGPLHGVTQCLVTFQPTARTDEKAEPIIEPVAHLGGRHRRHARGRQLDRQGDPVEVAADLHHGGGSSWSVNGIPADRLARARRRGRPRPSRYRRQIQRWHCPQLLVANAKPFTAGGKNIHGRRAREDGLDQVGSGIENMLAVVEDQQSDPALQRSGHRLADGLIRLLGDAQHRRHRVGHSRRISDGCEFENPNTVGEFIGKLRRDLQRKAGLADPAHTGQRHQPVRLDCRFNRPRPRTRARSSWRPRAADFPESVERPQRVETPCEGPLPVLETPRPASVHPATFAAPDRAGPRH